MLPPNPDGLMPDADVKRLKEFGDEINRRFSHPIASTSGVGKKFILKLPKRQKVNQLVLMKILPKENVFENLSWREKQTQGGKQFMKVHV